MDNHDLISNLISRGKLDEANKLLKKVSSEILDIEQQVKYKILMSRFHLRSDHFELSTKIANEAHKMAVNNKFDELIIKSLIFKTYGLLKQKKLNEFEDNHRLIEGELKSIPNNSLLKTKMKSWSLLLQGDYFKLSGEFSEAEKKYLESEILCKKSGDNSLMMEISNKLGIIFDIQGRSEKSLSYLNKTLTIAQKLGHERYKMGANVNIGMIHWGMGNLDIAVTHYTQALDTALRLNDLRLIGYCKLNIGLLQISQGRLLEAENNLKNSLEILTEIGDKTHIISALINLGIISDIRGQFTSALKFYKEASVISKEIGDLYNKHKLLNNLALTYKNLNNFELAEKLLKESLELSQKIGHPFGTASTLYNLLDISANQDKIEQATSYFNNLVTIKSKHNEDKRIELYEILAKVSLLKSSDRLIDRAEALKMIEELEKEEIPDFHLHMTAKLTLCDLLIFESQSMETSQPLERVEKILDELMTSSDTKQYNPVNVEVLILQSRLLLAKGEITEANDVLEQALNKAKQHNYTYLVTKVESEISELQEDLEKWEELTLSGSNLLEMIKESKFEQYIKLITSQFSKLS